MDYEEDDFDVDAAIADAEAAGADGFDDDGFGLAGPEYGAFGFTPAEPDEDHVPLKTPVGKGAGPRSAHATLANASSSVWDDGTYDDLLLTAQQHGAGAQAEARSHGGSSELSGDGPGGEGPRRRAAALIADALRADVVGGAGAGAYGGTTPTPVPAPAVNMLQQIALRLMRGGKSSSSGSSAGVAGAVAGAGAHPAPSHTTAASTYGTLGSLARSGVMNVTAVASAGLGPASLPAGRCVGDFLLDRPPGQRSSGIEEEEERLMGGGRAGDGDDDSGDDCLEIVLPSDDAMGVYAALPGLSSGPASVSSRTGRPGSSALASHTLGSYGFGASSSSAGVAAGRPVDERDAAPEGRPASAYHGGAMYFLRLDARLIAASYRGMTNAGAGSSLTLSTSGGDGVGGGLGKSGARGSGSGLLPVPITTLLARLDALASHRSEAAIRRAEKVLSGNGLTDADYADIAREEEAAASGVAGPQGLGALSSSLDMAARSFMFNGSNGLAATSSGSGQAGAGSSGPSLWVDKYSPSGYVDLLSNEGINRTVLKWIKLWDGRVHGGKGGKGGAGKGGDPSAGPAAAASRGSTFFSVIAAQAAKSTQAAALAAAATAGAGSVHGNKRARVSEGGGGVGGTGSPPPGASPSSSSSSSSSSAPSSSSSAHGGFDPSRRKAAGGYSKYGGGKPGEDGKVEFVTKPSYYPPREWPFGFRADSRALMLAGGPGLGKTTLAHILASHAGYRPMEINASDERSGKSLRERIIDAQGTTQAFGDSRPVLVIVDECDGLDNSGSGGGVSELVKLIKNTVPPFKYGGSDVTAAGGGAKHRDDGGSDDSDNEGDSGAGRGKGASSSSSSSSSKNRGKGRRPVGGDGSIGGNAGNDGDDEGEGRTSSATQGLTRPILLICNQPFAPALRELRQHVQIVEFPPTPTDRLVERLRYICTAEGMQITNDALQHLARQTDNDIRSCLNTLQYLRAQVAASAGRIHGGRKVKSYYGLDGHTLGNEEEEDGGGAEGGLGEEARRALRGRVRVTSDMITRACVGVKDQTKALHTVWEAVFTAPDTRQRSTAALKGLGLGLEVGNDASLTSKAMPPPGGEEGAGSLAGALGSYALAAQNAARLRAGHFSALHNTLTSYSSEPGLLLAGIHENLVSSTRSTDHTLRRTAGALDWLSAGELLTSKAGGAAGGLHKYVALSGLGVHLALSSELKPKVAWPRADAALRFGREAKANLLSSFLVSRGQALASAGGLAAAAGCCINGATALLDVLPPLLTIVSPPMRVTQLALLNAREKAGAQELVCALVSCGLTYAPNAAAAASGGFSRWNEDAAYTLSPDIGTLLQYAGVDPYGPDSGRGGGLPPVMRPMIAHEVRFARLRAMHEHSRRAAEAAAAAAKAGAGPSSAGHDAAMGSDGTPSTAAASGALPEHVKRLLEAAKGAGGAPLSASAAALAVLAPSSSFSQSAPLAAPSGSGVGRRDTPSSAPVKPSTLPSSSAGKPLSAGMAFLAAAASKSRQVEATRKRNNVALLSSAAGGSRATAAATAAAATAAATDGGEGEGAASRARAPSSDASVNSGGGASSSSGGGAPGVRTFPVVYRYQEGFSNAVRRPVRLRDLLL